MLTAKAFATSKVAFLFFCVASPGKTNDGLSFVEAGGNRILHVLPKGVYFVGDAAYEMSDQFLLPDPNAITQLMMLLIF